MPDCDKKKDAKEGEVPLAEKLLKSRTILVSKPVDDKMFEAVSAQLLVMQQEDPAAPIYVYVNSPGGSADCGFAIYDMLRFIGPKVITICSGLCASAAVLIYLGARKGNRFSLTHSRFLIHQPSTMAEGTASDLQITAKEIIKLRQRYNEIVAAECGTTAAQVTEDSSRDFWLSPEEAKKYGLVDRILTGRGDLPV